MPVELILDLPTYVEHEIRRQPWLTETERMAVILKGVPQQYDEDELAEAEEKAFEEGKQEGIAETLIKAANEIDAILDKFDVDEPDYATQVVAAINAWLKENL